MFLKLDFHKAYDRLDRAFLRLVLERRGIDDRINLNREIGPYFRPFCGVRQGTPSRPSRLTLRWMPLQRFWIETESLATYLVWLDILSADDTMIMVHGSKRDIINLKFLILYFESMSGLKINFDKSEVIILGFLDEDR